MKKFIGYFDYLGFKEFIENNDLEKQRKGIRNNAFSMESALGQDKFKNATSDLSECGINCINFSDTILFWTNDNSQESLIEFIKVTYNFNWKAIIYSFPIRGAIVFDEFEYDCYEQKGFSHLYNMQSIFGKGLVKAHLKANQQNWAGTVIDQSFIDEIELRELKSDEFLQPYAKRYKVPYKGNFDINEEFVFKLEKGILNEFSFKNISELIRNNFASYNKSIDTNDVQDKLKNTIKFLETFLEKK